jgi:putative transposase
MPYRKVALVEGQAYHVYNRGVNHGPLFFCDENWRFFLERLRQYFVPEQVEILAYCLMPNHYHLLVRLKSDGFGRRVMQPFGVSYTKAVNKQQRRVGPLFQGPFQAKWVDKDEYLVHLSRYIHLNPVVAGLVARAEGWLFSSYQDYVGLRKGTLPATELILSQFPSRQGYRAFVESYVASDLRVIEHLLFEES